MENLLPRAAYDHDETGYWRRLPYAAGLLFATLTVLIDFVFSSAPSRFNPVFFAAMIVWGVFSGIFFGLLFPLAFRRKMRRMTDRLYSGDTWIDVPPSRGQGFDHRLVCSRMEGKLAIGGVLYVGELGLLFLSHKWNGRKWPPIMIAPLAEVTIGLTEVPSYGGLMHLLIPHPQRRLEIQWPGGSAQFIVPTVKETSAKLRQIIETLQAPRI
jgi:hypothetical protein